MITRNVALVVQGLFERSDSIGYDCIFHYRTLQARAGGKVLLFAERWDPALYPGADIRPISEFFEFVRGNPEALVIYHYCDGWPEIDEFLLGWHGRVVLRWHNNTPPWFYLKYSPNYCDRTVAGYESILHFIGAEHLRFATNSAFTTEQLVALGCAPDRCTVVYPASRFLEGTGTSRTAPDDRGGPGDDGTITGPAQVLFVSRLVPHKGHKHVLAASALAQQASGRRIAVNFVGRGDSALATYEADLKALAERLDVELKLHGEVTQEELGELYERADVFVCLSEHEGFGMPVFEAMRCGIPVVAWAVTAFRELLEDHPLCPREFKLTRFAACIAAALGSGSRPAVLEAQRRVLARYTREIVEDQLDGLLASSDSLPPVRSGLAGSGETSAGSDLKRELDRIELDLATEAAEALLASSIFDATANLVSRYDLETYRFLSDRMMDLRFDSAATHEGAASGQRRAEIGALEFQSHVGQRGDTAITIRGPVPHDHHLIFGPYVHFPEGRFHVVFRFRLRIGGEERVQLRFEAVSTRHGLLGSRTEFFGDSEEEHRFPLAFENGRHSDVLELRIHSAAAFPGELTFLGVEVERSPLLSELPKVIALPAKEKAVEEDASRPALSRIFRRGSRSPQARATPETARKLFRHADHLRDRENWLEAANYYREGLRLAPDHPGYLVQLGNVLKEGGAFVEAERAYRSALKLDPHNRDTLLQLGDLLKRAGRILEAEQAFIAAASGGRAAISAYAELVGLGIDAGAVLARIAQRG